MMDPFISRAADFEHQHRLYMRAFGGLESMQDGVPGNVNELRLLRDIADVSDGMAVRTLASWLHLNPSLVSHLVARLQREGLVRFLECAHWDARLKLFVATPAGRAVANDFGEELQLCARKLLGRAIATRS